MTIKIWKNLFNEYFKQILDYKNHKVFDVEHSIDRYRERVDDNLALYTALLKKGIDWIIQNKKENIEDRYIFISKKYGFGIQVHWRKDRYYNKFNAYSATTFSNDEMNFFTKADKKLFLENVYKLYNTKNIDKEYYRYRFEGDLDRETRLIDLDMFIEDNKIYHTYEIITL